MWSRSRLVLPGLLLAACNGGDAPAEDPPDAAVIITGLITVHTGVGVHAVPHAEVVISHPDGTFRERLISDDQATVQATIEPGALVTVLLPDRGQHPFAGTVAGVQIGDELDLLPAADLGPSSTSSGIVAIDLPEDVPGANQYVVLNECSYSYRPFFLAVQDCDSGGHADAIAVAVATPPGHDDPNTSGLQGWTPLAYAAQPDVQVGEHVALGPWRPLPRTTLEVSHPIGANPTFTPWLYLLNSTPPNLRHLIGMPFGTTTPILPIPSTVELPYIPDIGAGWYLAFSSDSSAGRQLRSERHAGPIPPTIAIDLTTDILPPPSDFTVSATDPARPTFTWRGNEGGRGTATTMYGSFAADDGTVHLEWQAQLPPGTSSFQLPELTSVEAVEPPSELTPHIRAWVEVLASSSQCWDEFRLGPPITFGFGVEDHSQVSLDVHTKRTDASGATATPATLFRR